MSDSPSTVTAIVRAHDRDTLAQFAADLNRQLPGFCPEFLCHTFNSDCAVYQFPVSHEIAFRRFALAQNLTLMMSWMPDPFIDCDGQLCWKREPQPGVFTLRLKQPDGPEFPQLIFSPHGELLQ